MVGLLLVDGAGVDRLRQELVDAVRRHQRRALHALPAQLEAVRHLHLIGKGNFIIKLSTDFVCLHRTGLGKFRSYLN